MWIGYFSDFFMRFVGQNVVLVTFLVEILRHFYPSFQIPLVYLCCSGFSPELQFKGFEFSFVILNQLELLESSTLGTVEVI